MSTRLGLDLAQAAWRTAPSTFVTREMAMYDTSETPPRSARDHRVSRRDRRAAKRWGARASVVAGVIATTLGAGIAFAAWSSNGVGTSSAKAGTAQAVTAGTATPSGTLLYPTGTATAPLAITINNPNSYPVKVSGISLAVQSAPASVVTPNNASCTTSTAHVATSVVSVTGLSISIAAGGSATYTTTGNIVTMALDSDDGCQNATFTFANATVTAASG